MLTSNSLESKPNLPLAADDEEPYAPVEGNAMPFVEVVPSSTVIFQFSALRVEGEGGAGRKDERFWETC
jgi:hypothetical protein